MPLRFAEQRPPSPPLDLIQRVSPPFTASNADTARRDFDEAAVPHLVGLERALGLLGCEFSDFERMLDFGCGPGRYITWSHWPARPRSTAPTSTPRRSSG
jgi:hypothetical protein